MRRKDALGKSGEAHARIALEARGFTFVEANWHCRAGELDLIMRDGDELVFVEVKTRRGSTAGTAVESVSDAKARRLLQAGDWYVADHPHMEGVIWRIDLVAIDIDTVTGIASVQHVPNAIVSG